MLNKEYYAKEIIELAIANEGIAVTSKGVCRCYETDCDNCVLSHCNMDCEDARVEWANQKVSMEEVKSLDDELFDIYIRDGKQLIESLREIYEKGRADERKKVLDEVRDAMTYVQEGLGGYFTITAEEWERLEQKK